MRRRRSGGNEEGRGLQLAEMAYVPEEDGRRRGARRMPPTDRADRAQKGRRDLPVAPDVPPLKRKQGGAQSGKAGRHGVDELDKRHAGKETPWLIWRARLSMPGHTNLLLGKFPTADDAARAYDAEVRRRGWANARPLNFPQPEEQGNTRMPRNVATSEVCPSRFQIYPPAPRSPPPLEVPWCCGRQGSALKGEARAGSSACQKIFTTK